MFFYEEHLPSHPCPFLKIQHQVLKLLVLWILLRIWWEPWTLFLESILWFCSVQNRGTHLWMILKIKKPWETAHTQLHKTYLPLSTVIPELLKQHLSLDCDLELPGKWFLRVVRPKKCPPASKCLFAPPLPSSIFFLVLSLPTYTYIEEKNKPPARDNILSKENRVESIKQNK